MAKRMCSNRVFKTYLCGTLVVITITYCFIVWHQEGQRQSPVWELEVNFKPIKVHLSTTKKPLLASPANIRYVKVHHPTTKKPLLVSPSNFSHVKVHHPTTKTPLLVSPSNFNHIKVHHPTTKTPLLVSQSNFNHIKVHHPTTKKPLLVSLSNFKHIKVHHPTTKKPLLVSPSNFNHIKVHHPTTKKPLLVSLSNFKHIKLHHPRTKKPLFTSPSNIRYVKLHHPTTKKPILVSPSNFSHVKVQNPTTKKLFLATTSNFSHVEVHYNKTNSTSRPLLVSPSPVEEKDLVSIQLYHCEERHLCEQKMVSKTDAKWCPCIPPGLQGRVFVNMIDDKAWDHIVGTVGSDVLAGGEWKPPDCLSHTRLAIVIPCRDREHHLRVLLRHLIPILKRQRVHFRVFVVDQRFPAVFNRAAIMNIGFLEAAKRFTFDCVIFHDVDMILEDDRCLMTCGPEPRHYARSVDKFNYSVYKSFGGVGSIKPELFRMINGYPLKYFGWGGEDNDMWSRISRISSMYMPPPAICRYSTIPHVRDIMNQVNPIRHALIAFAKNSSNHSYDGLSDLDYEVNDVQLTPLYTRFEVDINITNLSSYYPSHPISQYRRSAGKCIDNDAIMTSPGLSSRACRFMCDTMVDKPCHGFSHLHGICTIILAACRLTLKENAWTYVKG